MKGRLALATDGEADSSHVHSFATCPADADGPSIMWLCGFEPYFTERSRLPFRSVRSRNRGIISGLTPPLNELATVFTIPTWVATKQDDAAQIGPCPHGSQAGFFVSKPQAETGSIGLRLDGTWDEHGDAFPSAQAAYEALLATDHVRPGD